MRKVTGFRKEMKNRGKAEMIITALAIILTVILTIFFLNIKAEGNDDIDGSRSAYYHEMEARYTEVLKVILEDNGLYNAGINISSIIEADGSRQYKVSVHHDLIGFMTAEETEALMSDLCGLPFADASVPVEYSIIY